MKRFWILLPVFFCLAACHPSGRPEDRDLRETGIFVISDALSNQKVNAFTEDADGHIWIATFRGLNQYNVHEYHQYFCTDDTLGLPDNQINDIYSSRSGQLWAATVNGLAFQTETGEFHRVTVPGYNRNINRILEAPDGRMLMSNMTSLFVYDSGQDCLKPVIRDYNAFGIPAETWVDDRLWVITGGNTLTCYNSRDFTPESSIPIPFTAYHICHAGGGKIWLSGMGNLRIYDTVKGAWTELPEAIRRNPVLTGGDIDLMYALDDGSILLNVIGNGVFCYFSSSGRLLRQGEPDFPYDIPQGEIHTVFQDSRHNLWFGTTDQGYSVSYQYKNQFNSNKFLTGYFNRKTVTSLCPDTDGRLWITTLRDGLFLYDRGAGTILPVDVSGLIQDKNVGYIRCSKVFRDAEGDYWLLFTDKYRAVRCQWDGKRFHMLDNVSWTNPISIAQDDRGMIWIGGVGDSLLRYDKKTRSGVPVRLTAEPGWTFITDLLLSQAGTMVAAAFNLPLFHINTYTDEVSPLELSEEERAACIRRSVLIPNCLFRDSAGDLWIGTVANGLLLHSRKGGTTAPVADLPCLDVCSIQEDRQGNVWVSTMNGLGKFDRTTGQILSYFTEDGIGGNQFSDRASCVLSDGTLVFGGTHGITWFNPLDVSQKRSVPLVFENLKVHNQLVQPGPDAPVDKSLSKRPDITLRHDQNGFSISFAALDYSELERTHYQYRMEGFDRYWVEAGDNNEAYYANLPTGKYRFRVRIDNNNHSIVPAESYLNVRVLPPWNRTWWARTVMVLVALGFLSLLALLYRRNRRERAEHARHLREEQAAREKVRLEKEQEQRLNKIQMNYFANVAHEFRTPLTMIAGPVSELSASPDVKGRDRKLVGIIQRNATWMLSLVNQLLDFNRIGNSKLQLKVAKTDIIAPLQSIVELFRFNAASKKIDLSAHGLEESFVMWADVDKVQKITMNLLSNALKYTPSGGKVDLSFDVLPREDVSQWFPLQEKDTDSQYACLSVADTGSGIAADELEKIFDRFYRSDGTKKMQGTGIGLYYARALCTFHHGYIKAWNRDEGGAVFRFILPVSASSYTEDERTERQPEIMPLPAIPESHETEGESGQRLIAVVDDDIDVANYVKVLLQPTYRVNVYFDANTALSGMAEETPDLVISDVVMPGRSGYELCEAIKNDLQLSHIPVILVTAKVAVESQVEGLGKGADAYVTKPFQPAYLLALVKSLLENREKVRRQLGEVTTTEDIEPEVLSPRDAAFMKELYSLMEKELDNTDLDITRITEMMHISRTKFYYKVKGLTGENPSVFFKRYKLNRAADLLKEGKHNMSEIAWMTGFNTLSHFSTSFKKQFGVPPSEYAG